jgi:hypothetical protein
VCRTITNSYGWDTHRRRALVTSAGRVDRMSFTRRFPSGNRDRQGQRRVSRYISGLPFPRTPPFYWSCLLAGEVSFRGR